jgi:hypothetical protein
LAHKLFGKIGIFLGAGLVFAAVGGASSLVYPQFRFFYFLAAMGLTVIIGGLLAPI